MYKCKHFTIKELVPEDVYKRRGEKAWTVFDDRALMTLDALRDKFGSLTVNDWSWGGTFSQSGLRTSDSKHYSQYSQHTFGRAFDCKFKEHTAEEVREYVLANKSEFPYIGGLELGISWFHFDVRGHDEGEIITFYPYKK